MDFLCTSVVFKLRNRSFPHFLIKKSFAIRPRPENYDPDFKFLNKISKRDGPTPVIVAQSRTEDEKGKTYVKKKKSEGLLPAVVYGKNPANPGEKQARILVNVPYRLIETQYHLRKYSFEGTLYDLELDGQKFKVLPRQLKCDSVKPSIIESVNFLIYNPQKTVFPVPFEFKNIEDCVAIKRGALLLPINYKVNIRCTDFNLPKRFEVDLTEAKNGEKIRLRNIPIPNNVIPTVQEDFLVALVVGKLKRRDLEELQKEEEAKAQKKEAKAKEKKEPKKEAKKDELGDDELDAKKPAKKKK